MEQKYYYCSSQPLDFYSSTQLKGKVPNKLKIVRTLQYESLLCLNNAALFCIKLNVNFLNILKFHRDNIYFGENSTDLNHIEYTLAVKKESVYYFVSKELGRSKY